LIIGRADKFVENWNVLELFDLDFEDVLDLLKGLLGLIHLLFAV